VHLASNYLRTEVRSQLRSGAWESVRPGAYVDALGSDQFTRRRLKVLALAAAVNAQTTSAHIFSHETAAVLHGLPVVGVDDQAHLVQQFRPGTLGAADLKRHYFPLPPEHTAVRHGLPVTSLERTVVDCASSLGRRNGLIIADAALHIGADRETCERILAGLPGRRGVVGARWVLEMADGGAESPGETLARFEMLLGGLPRPVTQVVVETHLGNFWGDLGWPEERVILEYDGVAKYEANGRASDAVLAEKRRQEAMEAAGWIVIRVTAADLRAPAHLLRTVRATLHTRRPSPAGS